MREKRYDFKSFKNCYIDFWKNVTNFSGKSDRYDFWVPTIINLVLLFVIFPIIGFSNDIFFIVELIVGVVIYFAQISIIVRRLRDAGQNVYLAFLLFVSGIGDVVLIYFLTLPSVEEEGENVGQSEKEETNGPEDGSGFVV